jgi:uncharacterized protein (DUF2164 family)
MTNAKRLTICAVLLGLSLAVGCKHHGEGENEFHPSPLAAGLYSGQSLQTADRKLNMMAGNFDVLLDRKPLPSDTRPPYRLLIISKKGAQVEGQQGELVLMFFNDRLMAMQFYAQNMNAARAAVEAQQHISLREGASHLEPSTRVWIGKDEQGRNYIGWIDKALQAEQEAWIRQYGNS